MADGGEEKGKNNDFYQVLGLNKECSATELRSAYKKLALRWHPDRCSASGNSKFVEEAQRKFQAIQQAYSVLSDTNKRFLYDVGVYDSDDDENGMGDFLNEMAVMMSQTKPSENMEESFDELRELFDEMFQEDLNSFGIDSQAAPSCSPSHVSSNGSSNSDNERVPVHMNLGKTEVDDSSSFNSHFEKFCLGRWHPDRCSASGNSKFVEEAQRKFQAIQQAYSVLSDTNKRFLYDVGVYDNDYDENGMGDFLNEMAVMMSQTKPSENMEESFEELRELFDEMFQEDLNSFGIDRQAAPSCSPSHVSSNGSSNSNNERVPVDMNLGKTKVDDSSSFNSHFEKFCLGVEQRQPFKKVEEAVRGGIQGGAGGRRRQDKNQKVSSGYDVSSHDYGISAS